MSSKKILGNTVTVLACLLILSVSNAWAADICKADLDFSGDVYPGDAMIMLAEWGREDCAPNGPAMVPKTGQTTQYALGDDGDLEKGVAWPNPRFKDNGNGTVTDNLTGLIWLKNANCFDIRNWSQALTDCNGLNSGECGLTDGSIAGDWRLPNRSELNSLIDVRYYNPALSNTAGTGQWSAGNPFTNVQSGLYWSSTTYAGYTDAAWGVVMDVGDVYGYNKSYNGYVWPVRGGQ